jgi:IS30 family transposase
MSRSNYFNAKFRSELVNTCKPKSLTIRDIASISSDQDQYQADYLSCLESLDKIKRHRNISFKQQLQMRKMITEFYKSKKSELVLLKLLSKGAPGIIFQCVSFAVEHYKSNSDRLSTLQIVKGQNNWESLRFLITIFGDQTNLYKCFIELL